MIVRIYLAGLSESRQLCVFQSIYIDLTVACINCKLLYSINVLNLLLVYPEAFLYLVVQAVHEYLGN